MLRSRPSALLVLFMIAASALLTACFDQASKVNDSDVQIIKPEELAAMLEKPRQRPLIVDVRSPQAYAESHIPGAVNIPLVELRENDPQLADTASIVVYDSDYTDAQSSAAAKKLLRMGYDGIYDLQGGLALWKAEQGDAAVEVHDADAP